MKERIGLLSIGEMAKLTGASVKKLRYYERIGILSPTYIASESCYRYYSPTQIYFVEFILFCIELNIPLKELTRFVHADSTVDYRTFLSRGREIAEKKLQTLRQGLDLICEFEQKLDLAEAYQHEELYERNLSAKYFYLKPIAGSIKDLNQIEIAKSFLDMPLNEDGYNSIPEYGVLCEQTQAGTSYYYFAEVPSHMAKGIHVKTIPAGKYICRQSKDSQIEQTNELFITYLQNKGTFLSIETHIFIGNHKLSAPIFELRCYTG